MCVRVPQGAALGAMVGHMTYGKRQFEALDSAMRRLIPPFHRAATELLRMVDADADAFDVVLTTMRLPRSSEEEENRYNFIWTYVGGAGANHVVPSQQATGSAAGRPERSRGRTPGPGPEGRCPLGAAQGTGPPREPGLHLRCSGAAGSDITSQGSEPWRVSQLLPVMSQVAAKALEAAAFGAYFNVVVNLKDVSDGDFKEAVTVLRKWRPQEGHLC